MTQKTFCYVNVHQNTSNHRKFVASDMIPWCITRIGISSVMVTLAFTSRITAWIAITGNYCSLAEWRLAGSPSHQISMSILLFKVAPRLYQVAQSVNESNLGLIVVLWLWTWSNTYLEQSNFFIALKTENNYDKS